MPRRSEPLVPGAFYHVYNRGHNRGRIFFEEENYLFFLRRLRRYLLPVLEVVAYCLMPTHYHLLVRVRELEEAETSEVLKTSEVYASAKKSPVANALRCLSISYTKAINKQQDRVGSLFQGAYQAKHVADAEYLLHLSCYLHRNPVAAGLAERPEAWPYSSYREYVGQRSGTLPRPQVVLDAFDAPADYRRFVEAYDEEATPEGWHATTFEGEAALAGRREHR